MRKKNKSIVLKIHNGIVSVLQNPFEDVIMLHDYDVQDTEEGIKIDKLGRQYQVIQL